MTDEKAQQLVNSYISKCHESSKLREFLFLEGLSNAIVGVFDIFIFTLCHFGSEKAKAAVAPLVIVLHSAMSASAALACSPSNENKEQAKSYRLYLLKQLKKELKNGINRFDDVEIEDFNKALEEIENKIDYDGYFITRKQGPQTRCTGLSDSRISVNKNGIVTECKLVGYWMTPEEIEESHHLVGKHISELQSFMKRAYSAAREYPGYNFDTIANKYVVRKKVLSK